MPRFAIEVERTVQLEHTLAHIDQPQPSRFCDLVWGAAYAVIGDRKENATVGPGKPNINHFGFRIFGGVAQCFLGNAVRRIAPPRETTPSHSRRSHTTPAGCVPC